MNDVYVVGVGMTAFGKYLDHSIKDLTGEAVGLALEDAGCEIGDIEAAWFSNTCQGVVEEQHLIRGQVALRGLGLSKIPVVNVENACASASTAFQQAWVGLKAGLWDVVLAVGSDKMYCADKAKSFAIFPGAVDVHQTQETFAALNALGEEVMPPEAKAAQSAIKSPFMDVYAALAMYHMDKYGLTQRQIASAASKNHYHSTFNPLSQYQNNISVEEVLAARMISWPLTLPMCAPISDGSAAAILCSKRALEHFDKSRAIKVHACELGSGSEREPGDLQNHVSRLTAQRAYSYAGLTPEDMSVAEVHDASAFAEILQTENLGFCPIGQGGRLLDEGKTRLGGKIPINVSGGLVSKGHPIGATGLGQIYELATQLRGEAGKRQVENPNFAISENGGGFIGFEEAAVCITILGNEY